jgi:2-polyprenyl-3-methyl-5-hydroxy-6-metoxy-1,4-benzoquinol methylase
VGGTVQRVTTLTTVQGRAWLDSWGSRRPPSFSEPVSQVGSAAQIEAPEFRAWCGVLHHPVIFHRKLWEWCYTLQVLERAGRLQAGQRALGFGVGTEPLPAVLASRGVEVVATDQPSDDAGQWAETGQHAESLDALLREDICPRDRFLDLVSFRPVDMRHIPTDLRGFDIVWSSCCFEHLGSPQAGLDFVLAAMDCLSPGGLAVHTTEYDVHESPEIVDLGAVVLYRRQELAWLAAELRRRGHSISFNFHLPDSDPRDRHEDEEPYSDVHLRVKLGPTAAASFGLVITKGH